MKKAISPTDTSTDALAARAVAGALSLQAGLEAAGIPPAQAATLAHPAPLPIIGLEKAAHNQTQRATTVYGLILIFILLSQYGTWILMGVVEEKSSRVVEVLLSTMRPVQLLMGKVLGIGAVALAQAGLLVVIALGLAAAVGIRPGARERARRRGGDPDLARAGLRVLLLGLRRGRFARRPAGAPADAGLSPPAPDPVRVHRFDQLGRLVEPVAPHPRAGATCPRRRRSR